MITNEQIKELKKRKKELQLTNETISKESGIPLSTVQKIFAGNTKNPRIDTMNKITEILVAHALDNSIYNNQSALTSISEENVAYDYAGYLDSALKDPRIIPDHHTASFHKLYNTTDYYALPDDTRVELIDGRIYDLSAPSVTHQVIILRLSMAIVNYIDENALDCELLFAPVDVRLNRDDYTMLEPDIVVICKKDDEDDRMDDERRIEGAPDFIVEVLSPSSISRDTGLKYLKYKKAGVREYWMVDPGIERITLCDFVNDIEETYSFEDTIPVHMTDNRLKIDFSKIKSHL